jgi:hypothetical protein
MAFDSMSVRLAKLLICVVALVQLSLASCQTTSLQLAVAGDTYPTFSVVGSEDSNYRSKESNKHLQRTRSSELLWYGEWASR